MANCLGLAWGLMPNRDSNMLVLGGEQESKGSMMRGLGCGSKRTLWHKRRECRMARARACMGSAPNILQVRGYRGVHLLPRHSEGAKYSA